MLRIKTILLALACITLLAVIGAPAVNAEPEEPSTWPIETDLVIKDWIVDEPDVFITIGKVYFVNSRDQLTVVIEPDAPYQIAKANVHVVQYLDDFDSVLDKKTGKPKPGKFDFKTDYLDDEGAPVPRHEQVVPFDHFEKVCWGMNKEQCPDFFVIAQAALQMPGKKDGEWVDVPEDAYASNGGQFDRYDPDGKDFPHIWAHYVTYPKAHALAGHFVDANVNGLSYATSTQSGITTGEGETGKDGQFWFVTGEQIGFSVGSLFIGDTLADRVISPVELFPGASMDDDRVANLARLLQSLDDDGVVGVGAINIGAPAVACLESALASLGMLPTPSPDTLFADDGKVEALISATVAACAPDVVLTKVSKEEALANLNSGMQAGNLMKRNISKTPDLADDKAKIEIMPVYVPARRPDESLTEVTYYYEDGSVSEVRPVAKPIVVTYVGEELLSGEFDVYVAISRDDGDSWTRRNISRTAGKSSLIGYPGKSEKPMLKVKDNLIFVAWTDKYCKGGRPGYAINVCPDTNDDGLPDTCEVCRDHYDDEGEPVTVCTTDYPGDDAYWKDDIFGVAGPQRLVDYEGEDGMHEVPYSCVWSARGIVATADDVADGLGDFVGDIVWFKPERLTSGRRDAYQLFAGAGDDVAFGIVWQEDPKGLMPGEGDGPGDGWSGANTHSKSDIWYSYITMDDFALVDWDYPVGGHGEIESQMDMVDSDEELQGRLKALVPMSLPVKISDNDVCSRENILAEGGGDDPEHEFDHDGEGTHRYCGTIDGIGTPEVWGSNDLCVYTLPKTNPEGTTHDVCVTRDGRYLDGNTGASRPNLFLQPYKKSDGSKGAWAIIGYEESKGVGSPPEDEEGCGDEVALVDDGDDDDHEDRYKPDSGKNVIYHSFAFDNPETVASGGILNLPETDEAGAPVYLVDEFGADYLDWKGEQVLAYENARRIRFLPQPKSKAVKQAKGGSGTVLVALYRQGEEGSGKPADIFMRRISLPDDDTGNPYAFSKFECDKTDEHVSNGSVFCSKGARNLSSVTPDPDYLWQNPLTEGAPVKMLRWGWTPDNLDDSSAKNPYTDSRAHRGALNGDDLIIGYTWTPNWGRNANDKYDFYVRRSFNGGGSWTTDPKGSKDPEDFVEHNVVFRTPVLDDAGYPILDENDHVVWEEEVVTTTFGPGATEPPRNVSNLRNYRTSVMEPRLVKTPGTIAGTEYLEDIQDTSVYQVAYGVEFNQNATPNDVIFPKKPLDILYGRTTDKGQRFESVIVTPQSGGGKPEEGLNPLAQDKPEQGAAQLRQTPDGSRMYGIWLEEGDQGSDIMFRRVDYRVAPVDPE